MRKLPADRRGPPVPDRRTNARSLTSPDFARLLLHGRRDLPCRVIDRSDGGMRLVVHGEPVLPARFSVEMFMSGDVIPVVLAWQRPNEVGLAVEGRIEPSASPPIAL